MRPDLRYYQKDCEDAVVRDIAYGHTRLACVLPTGSGKTTIFGSICKNYTKSFPNKKVLIVSHLGLLVSQTGQRFDTEWGIKTGILQGQRLPNKGDRVIVTTMQSSRERGKIERWARSEGSFSSGADKLDIGMIIIDECHYAQSASYTAIIEMFPKAIILGFTATPFRQNKLMTDMFEKVSYTVSMRELIDKGYLVEPRLNLVPFDTTDEADMYNKMINIYKDRHLGQKAVIFLRTIEEANLCRNVFDKAGISCSAVTSKLIGEGRDDVLTAFKMGGGPDVLTTVDVLTAGFDSPNLCAIFMPFKIGSVTTYLQRVGRGLRPFKDKDHCDIYAGSTTPNIEDGFWERMNKKMLHGGRKSIEDYDSFLEIIEYAKEKLSEERYRWTIDVINMANAVKNKGMQNVHDMIIYQQFPEDMLDVFVNSPPTTTKKGAKIKATSAQRKWLEDIGLWNDKLTKPEASAIITGHRKAKGLVQEWEKVPAGKHTGKLFSEVPPMYWRQLAYKFSGSEAYKAYNAYKKRIGK